MSVAVAHQINKASDVVLAAAVTEAALRGTQLVVLHVVTSKDLDSEEALRQGIGDLVAAAVAGPGRRRPRVGGPGRDQRGLHVDDTAGAILDAVERAGPTSSSSARAVARRSARPSSGASRRRCSSTRPIPVLVVKGSAS